eukprot:scaffold5158_cov153-Amphora_coffeaeformis.AAC.2
MAVALDINVCKRVACKYKTWEETLPEEEDACVIDGKTITQSLGTLSCCFGNFSRQARFRCVLFWFGWHGWILPAGSPSVRRASSNVRVPSSRSH